MEDAAVVVAADVGQEDAPKEMKADAEPDLLAPTYDTHFEQLPNDLWVAILNYLPYSDLLQLRLVSKRWCDVVSCRVFLTLGKVIVTRQNLHDIKTQVESGVSNIRFECLELRNLRPSSELVELLGLIGHEVGCLHVRHSPIFGVLENKLPNLKMFSIATTSFMDDSQLEPVEGINLEQFTQLHSFECDGVSLDASLKLEVLRQLRRGDNRVRLQHFQFEYRNNNEKPLLDVVRDHAKSLVYLDIFFSCSPGHDTSRWGEAFSELSNVRTLKMSGNCHHELLKTIMAAVPESAPLYHLDLTGMLSLTNDLLLLIACKWHHSLRILDLMFCVQLDGRCVEALQHLSGDGALQALTMAYCRELTGRGLLEGLARKPNYALQELHLEEVCFIDEDSICLLLERLPNMQKLSLDNCRHAVTDRTLAVIFEHQTKLQELNIDYCVRITDAGLLGFGHNPCALSSLRGLRVLNMRGCRNLTNRVLMETMCLPELRCLSVGYCHRFKTEGVIAFTAKCPAIERLCMASCLLVDDDAVLSIVTNLKRLRCLNLSNCLKLTLHSIYHVAQYGQNMMEFTACGIDSFDPNAAKCILKIERPQLKQVLL